MLKRLITIIFILLITIICITSCKEKSYEETGGKADQKENEQVKNKLADIINVQKKITNEKDDYYIKVEANNSQTDVFKDIDTDFEQGDIDEKSYCLLKSQAIFEPDIVTSQYGNTIFSDTIIDPSYEIQWLMNHFEELEDSEQAYLKETLQLDYMSNLKDNANKTSLIDFFIPKVYAETNSPTYYSKQITPNVELVSTDQGLIDYYSEMIELATIISEDNYEELSGFSLNNNIVVFLDTMISSVPSYSFLMPMLEELNLGQTDIHIHLNSYMDNNTFVGTYLHELFHAYQYSNGYTMKNYEERFVMESTTIWAVAKAYSEIKYHQNFNNYLFDDPAQIIAVMNDCQMKSWYQLYYYASEVDNNNDMVKNLLISYLENDNLNDAMDAAAGGYEELNNLFNDFSISYAVLESPKPVADETATQISFAVTENNIANEDEIIAKYNGKWQEVPIVGTGFRPAVINLSDTNANKIEVMTNLKQGRTNMSVLVEEDGIWTVEMDRYSEFPSVVIDLKDRNIQTVLMVLYSYDFSDIQNHEFNVTFSTEINGNGLINCNVHKESLPVEGEDTLTEDYNLIIDETVKLYRSTVSDDSMDFSQLILGDVFYIEKIDVSLFGNYLNEFVGGDKIEKVYSGSYNYNNGDLPIGTFEQNILSIPELPFAIPNTESSNAVIDSFLPEGMSMDGLMDMLPESEKNALQEDVNELNDELNNSSMNWGDFNINDLFAPSNQINRFIIDDNSQIFRINKQFPPDITTTKWVTEKFKFTEHKDDGTIETTENTSMVSMPNNSFLPIWFYNPCYDEEEAQDMANQLPNNPMEFMDESMGLEDINNQLATLNGLFDKSNLYPVMNEGEQRFDMELINPDLSGILTQNIEFMDNHLSATINAQYTDEVGTLYEVTIEMEYDFN